MNNKRKSINTTLNEELYNKIKILAAKLTYEKNMKICANDLIEEGMQYIIDREEKKED